MNTSIHQAPSKARDRDDNISSRATRLCFPRLPLAVSGFISSVIRDSANRVFDWACSHISKEQFKGIAPAVADRNPAPAVILKLLLIRVCAPLNHRVPTHISRIAFADSGMAMSHAVSSVTSAGSNGPQFQESVSSNELLPAVRANANAAGDDCPSRKTLGRRIGDNFDLVEDLSNEGLSFWHNSVRALFCKLRAVGLMCRQSAAILAAALLWSSPASAGGWQFNNYDYEVRTWAKVDVPAQSSTVSGATYMKSTRFFHLLRMSSLRQRIVRMNLFVGDDINTLKQPIIHDICGTTTDILQNFAGGAYTEATGLAGDATSTYLRTGCVLSLISNGDKNDIHWAIYNRTPTNQAGVSSLANPLSGYNLGVYPSYLNTTYAYIGDNFFSLADTNGTGLYQITRNSATSGICYKNGVNFMSTATPGNSALSGTVYMTAYAQNNNGSFIAWSSRTLAFYSGGYSMTAAQALTYYNLVQAFQSWFNRQV